MRKTTILVVGSPSLARIIGYLFGGRPEFEVVTAIHGLGRQLRLKPRHLPELVVAHVKPVSIGICRLVASIREFSPLSRVILVCPVEHLSRTARECGADACLGNEKLAGHLLKTARQLSRPSRAGWRGE